MPQWWPEKWAVPIGDGDGNQDGHLVGDRYAWWQARKRRRSAYDRAARFDHRSIRISFRRPEDYWRNDLPPIRPRRGRHST